MIDKICRVGTAFLGALGAMELLAWFCEQCEVNVTVAPTTFCFILVMLTAIWFLIDGLCVSGFLIRRVTIKMPHIRTNINIFPAISQTIPNISSPRIKHRFLWFLFMNYTLFSYCLQ